MPSQDAIVAEIPRLRRYARALAGDAVRADDLVQDTLERALLRFALWRPGNLRAWLFSIMHNVFVNQMKAVQPLVFPGDEAMPDQPARAAQADSLELRDLSRALLKIPADQREVLLLIGLESLSYEEAAKVLGVPAGTVMSRLSRGRVRLQALLAGAELPERQLKVIK